jgi:glycosyltransferase involved in cell wall biosynthesis
MSGPVILVLAETFVPPSEVYVYRRTTHLHRIRPTVACFHRTYRDSFPFDPVIELQLHDPSLMAKGFNFALRRLGLIPWKTSLEGLRRFRRMLREVRPQAILCEGGYVATETIDMLPAAGLPFAVTFWGTDINAARSRPEYLEHLRRVFARGALFIYCCDFLRRQGIALGCPPERSVVIHNGVELPERPSWNPSPDGTLRLLCIARMSPVKGLDVLLQAAREVVDAGLKLRLSHVGSGRLSTEIRGLAAELRLGEVVRFLGPLPNPEAMQLLANADALVLSSVRCPDGDEEAFPTVVLEAGAHGVPAIASDIGGVSEALVHERTGLLVPERDSRALAEAIIRLARSPAEARVMGTAARDHVQEHFEVDRQVGLHEEALLRLTGSGANGDRAGGEAEGGQR